MNALQHGNLEDESARGKEAVVRQWTGILFATFVVAGVGILLGHICATHDPCSPEHDVSAFGKAVD